MLICSYFLLSRRFCDSLISTWSDINLITTDGAPWVQFSYMAADNNLDRYAVKDLEEMRTNNASINDISIVVLVDRCRECDNSNFTSVAEIYDYQTKALVDGKFTGAKLLQRGYDATRDINIWWQMYDFDKIEINSMTSELISNFVELMGQFALSRETQYYSLTFWDHGAAWRGYGGDDSMRKQIRLHY